MSTTYAVYASDGPLATLTFNRPEARNAMTWEMYQALVDACDRADDDPAVRVLILKGAGGKAFVAGTDIAQFQSFRGPEDGIAYEKRIDQVLDRLERVTKATIAQIQGVAAGGGCAIAFGCDLRVATPESSFGIPVARTLGNCLSGATYSRLVDLLGPGLVKDMLLTGRFVPAAEALGLGIVSRVEPAEEIEHVRPGVRASDRRQRAADGSSDEGDDPPHHGGTPPAARRGPGSDRDVLHEQRLSRRDLGVSGKAPAEVDGHVAVVGRQSSVGSRSRRQSPVDSRRSAVAVDSRVGSRESAVASTQGGGLKAALGDFLFERQLGMHGGRQRRAGEEEAHRADERQVPVAGRVDDESEREGRQDGRER